MQMEFLHGRPFSPDELAIIRRQIESFDDIGAVDDEIRGSSLPHLYGRFARTGRTISHLQPFRTMSA